MPELPFELSGGALQVIGGTQAPDLGVGYAGAGWGLRPGAADQQPEAEAKGEAVGKRRARYAPGKDDALLDDGTFVDEGRHEWGFRCAAAVKIERIS